MVSAATGGVLAKRHTPLQWRHLAYYHCHSIVEMSYVSHGGRSKKVIGKLVRIQRSID